MVDWALKTNDLPTYRFFDVPSLFSCGSAGQLFPTGFPDTVRKIHRYLFHMLAHIYHAHYTQMVQLGLQGHLNTLFSHFMVFSVHFHLLQDKEAEVLMDLHKGLLKAMQDPNQNSEQPRKDDSPDSQEGAAAAGEPDASSPPPPPPPPPLSSSSPQTVSAAESEKAGLSEQSLGSDKTGSAHRTGSENGAAATGMAVRGGKTLVDIPST